MIAISACYGTTRPTRTGRGQYDLAAFDAIGRRTNAVVRETLVTSRNAGGVLLYFCGFSRCVSSRVILLCKLLVKMSVLAAVEVGNLCA